MNFSLHLEERLVAALKRQAARSGRTRNALINEAVRFLTGTGLGSDRSNYGFQRCQGIYGFRATPLAMVAFHHQAPPRVIVDAVLKYDPAGFAVGGVNDCGGYAALWGRKDGAWKELIGTQDAWLCSDLKKYGVPAHGVVRTCIGGSKPSEMKEVPYTG